MVHSNIKERRCCFVARFMLYLNLFWKWKGAWERGWFQMGKFIIENSMSNVAHTIYRYATLPIKYCTLLFLLLIMMMMMLLPFDQKITLSNKSDFLLSLITYYMQTIYKFKLQVTLHQSKNDIHINTILPQQVLLIP